MQAKQTVAAAALTLIIGHNAAAEPVEFLVTELPSGVGHLDSFTISLEDPLLIEHARSLVEFGPLAGDPIVWARIASGGDGINRDVLAPGEPHWNWRVVEVEAFVGLTAEIFDGWPSFIGEDPPAWMDNTAPDDADMGYIGFWAYTVTAELGSPPAPCLADLATPQGSLDFSDISAFLVAFDRAQPPADLAEPFGSYDFSDVVAFLSAFGAGCP